MKHSTFADRLSYARWLAYLWTGEAPANTEIAEAVGRTGPWVTKWAVSETPPRDFEVHAPLAAYLDVDERWLVRGEGEPPEPALWAVWTANASRRAKAQAPLEPPKRKAVAVKEMPAEEFEAAGSAAQRRKRQQKRA